MIFSIILFLVFPVLGFPFYAFFYIVDERKLKKVYSFLLAIVFGIVSYYLIPKNDFDLAKLQHIVNIISKMDFSQFIRSIPKFDLEIIPLFYSYLISFTGNNNLLQFFIVAGGYYILLYVLSDYKMMVSKGNYIYFLLVVINIIFGVNILYYYSGLYCYFAMMLFLLVYYFDYFKKVNSKICIIAYLILPFVHSSLFLPVFLLLFYKLNNKLKMKQIIICILIFLFVYPLLKYLASAFSLSFISRVLMMYESYSQNNEHYKLLYSGSNYIIEISKLIVVLTAIFINKKASKTEQTNGFVILLSISTLLFMVTSSVAIRYMMLVHFLGIFPMINLIKTKRKDLIKTKRKDLIKIFFVFILLLSNIFYLSYFIKTIRFLNFGNLFNEGIYKSIFSIFK